jgi:hypothetical protein
MAFPAVNFLPDMGLMLKKDMLRDIIDFHPRGGGFGVKIVMLFFDLRMLCYNVLMTKKTFFHRWYPWKSGTGHIGMAELTLDFFYPGMNPVTECNGLFRTDICARGTIEINQKDQGQQDAGDSQQNRDSVDI